MNKIIRFGFATYESLVQKLGATDSPAAVNQLYQSHKDLFKHEHVVLSLRMLGRHSKQMTPEDNLQELTGKLNDIVGQLSEYDVVDVLFWLRKWRGAKLSTNITQATQQTLFTKIQQMAESHMFTFRNMVNVYYDLAQLGQNNDFLAKILQEQILISKQISPFILIQLMSAQVTKINNCNISKFDTLILSNAMKVIDNMLDDFDLEQKSLLFKTLSEVQFQNISPRFSLPIQIKRLKDSLLEKVELLQEESVLNIFRAYQHLPRYFENDLLRELKDMIITTIEQNPANLTSKFLVHLIERINGMAYVRVPFELTKKIVQELSKRITNKEVEPFLIIQLCNNVEKNQKHEELITALQTVEQLPPKALNLLYNNNVNLKSQVVALLDGQKKVTLHQAAHFVVYAQRDSKEHVEQLTQICKDAIQNNPQYALRSFKETDLMSGVRFQLQEEAYMAVIQQVRNKEQDFGKVVRDLLNGVANGRCRAAFIQLYEEQTVQNPKLLFNRLMQEFDTFNSETLNIVLQILQKDPTSIPINRLVDFLTLNQHKLMGLIKSDQIQWATTVLALPFLASTDLKLYPIINFTQRFENAGYHSRFVGSMLHKCYSHFRKQQPSTPFTENHFVQELISFGIFTPKDAIIQLDYERCTGQLRIQVLGIALQAEQVPDKVLDEANKIKSECLQQIQQDSTRHQALYNLITLGVTQELEEVRKHLKLTVGRMSIKNYFDLVMDAKDHQIIKDLAGAFQQLGPKLGINRVIRAVEKFQKSQVCTQMVYNILLEQLGANFHNIFNEQRIQILNIFAEGKLKQLDVFKKNLEKISKNLQQYKQYYSDILDQLFTLGLVETDIVTLVKQTFERAQLSETQAFKLLSYYIIADQPIEELEKIAELAGQVKSKELYKTTLLHEVIKRQYPESKVNAIFETLLKEESFQQSKENNIGGGKIRTSFPVEQVSSYLKALGVNFQANHKINDVSIEIYLPESDTAVVVLQGNAVNYDRTSLTGIALLQRRLIQLVAKNIITVNFKEFNQITNPDDKAKFLINSGIPATVDPKSADYSAVPKSYESNKKQDKQ